MPNKTISRTPQINDEARKVSDELLRDKKFMETVCLMTGMKFPTPQTKRLLQELEELKEEYEDTLPDAFPARRSVYTSTKEKLFSDIIKKTDELRNAVKETGTAGNVKSPQFRRAASWNKVSGPFPVLPEKNDKTVLVKGRFRKSGIEAFFTGKFLGKKVSPSNPNKAELRWFINMPYEDQSLKD